MQNITIIIMFLYQGFLASTSFAQLSADAGTDITLCQGEQVVLGGSPIVGGGTPPYTYSWSPQRGLSCANCANPTASPQITTTYTLTVTDANDNNAQDEVTVTINPNPVLTDEFGGSNFVQCTGEINYVLTVLDKSEPTNNIRYRLFWGDGPVNVADYDSNTFPPGGVQHTYGSGRFVLTYEITGANNCVSTVQYPVTNITNPAIGLGSPGNTIGCSPKEICFPINGFENNHASTTYEVDFGDGTDIVTFNHPPPDEICHEYSKESCSQPGGSFTFAIRAINDCKTTPATVSSIEIYTPPEAKFLIGPGCLNEEITFTNETTEGYNSSCKNNTKYTWIIDNNDEEPIIIFDKSPPLKFNFTATGKHYISLEAANSCGSSIFLDSVCIEPPPVPSFELDTINICGPNAQINTRNITNIQSSCGVAAFEWSIDPSIGYTFRSNDSIISTEFDDIIDFIESGNYTINLKYNNGCKVGSSSKSITIKEKLTISPDNIKDLPAQVCAPYLTNVTTDLVMPGSNDYLWQMLDENGNPLTLDSDNQQTPGQVMLQPGKYTMLLTVFNECGESNTVSDSIFVIEEQPANAGEDIIVCVNDSPFMLEGSPAGGKWAGSCITSEGRFDPACAGVNSSGVALTYTVGEGTCEAKDIVNIIINDLPEVNAGEAKSFCINDPPYDLEKEQHASPPGGIWVIDEDTTHIFDPSGLALGPHQIVYINTDPVKQCEGRDQIEFVINDPSEVDAGEAKSFCINDPAYDLSKEQNASPTGGIWVIEEDTTHIFNPSVIGEGIYTIKYLFPKDKANTCEVGDSVLFIINPLPQVNAGQARNFCPDSQPFDLAKEQNASPPGGIWKINGVENALFDPSKLPLGPHEIEYIYTDQDTQCEGRDQIFFSIVEKPPVDAGADLQFCFNQEPFDLNAKTDTSPSGGSWSGDGVTNGIFDPQITGIGTFEIEYVYTDQSTGCTNTDFMTIDVNDNPIVGAGNDITVCDNTGTHQLKGNSPKGGTWSGPGIEDSVQGIFNAYVAGPGRYDIIYSYSNEDGCTNSDTVTVTVCSDPKKAVQFADAFTPNMDNLNEDFGPIMDIDITTSEFYFQIVRRSNDVVFETKDPSERWDGTFNGEELIGPFGYKLYVKFISGLAIEMEGEVLVIRK